MIVLMIKHSGLPPLKINLEHSEHIRANSKNWNLSPKPKSFGWKDKLPYGTGPEKRSTNITKTNPVGR
jgi:hypothetical protein